MPTKCHHSAICVADFVASLRFYTEGLGLALLWEQEFEGDWPTLFGAPQPRLHSAFLGDPEGADAGIVELVDFPGRMHDTMVPMAVVRDPDGVVIELIGA